MRRVDCFCLAALSAALSCSADAGRIEGWWRFDEMQGEVARDISGNGRDALIDTNRVDRIRDAPGGGALWFRGVAESPASGVSAPVAVPDFSEVGLSNGLSVSAWVYVESAAPFASLVASSSSLGGWENGFGLYIGERGGIGAYVRSGEDGNAAEGGLLSTGVWRHVAMAYSGMELVLYLDGCLVASRSFSSAASADATAPLAIGPLQVPGSGPLFSGAIADVRVWSKALTQQEVRAAYAQFLGEALDPNADDDGDGMPNGWEIRHSLDPRDATDASLDSDGDGMTNLQEWRLGRNPRIGVSVASPSLIKSGTVVGP